MGVYSILSRFSRKQSRFRIIATIVSVVFSTLILATIVSLGQGWLQRQQKSDFVLTLFSDTRDIIANQDVHADSVYISSHDTSFQKFSIKEIGISVASRYDELPAGLNRLPPPDELWVTPALKRLIDANELLEGRYDGLTIKDTFPDALAPSPDSMMALFNIAGAALDNPQAQMRVTSVDAINQIYAEHKKKNDLQSQFSYIALMTVGIVLITPVLALITEVARIGMTQREKRYASLSLVGATTKQIRIMILLDTLPLSLGSVVAGLSLFLWLGVSTLSYIALGGSTIWGVDLRLSAMIYAVIGILVVSCVIFANLRAVRQVKLSPLAVSRSNGVKGYPSVLTITPLIVGLVSIYTLDVYGGVWYENNMTAGGLILASLLLIIILGILFGGPYMSYLLSLAVLRASHRAEGVLAAHRLRSVSHANFRNISGVIVALFVGTLLVTIMSTVQASSQAQAGGLNFELPYADESLRPFKVKVIESGAEGIDDDLVNKLRSDDMLNDSSSQMYTQWSFQEQDRGQADSVLQGDYYNSCLELRERTQMKCSDGVVGPVAVVLEGSSDSYDGSIFRREVVSVAGVDGRIFASSFIIIANSQESYSRIIQLAQNIASIHQRKTGVVVDVEYDHVDSYDDTIAYISNMNSLIMAMLVVVVITGGLSVFISVVGSVYERKKTFVQLRILGVGLNEMVRSLTIEVAVPLAVLSSIAVGLGIFSGYSLLSIAGAFENGLVFSFPGLAFWLYLLGANLLCTGLSLFAIPILNGLTKS